MCVRSSAHTTDRVPFPTFAFCFGSLYNSFPLAREEGIDQPSFPQQLKCRIWLTSTSTHEAAHSTALRGGGHKQEQPRWPKVELKGPRLETFQGHAAYQAVDHVLCSEPNVKTFYFMICEFILGARAATTQVVGRHRGWGASIAEVLDGVNRIIGSNKKDDYVSLEVFVWPASHLRRVQKAVC